MNLLITVCARGGSKGVPGKNVRPVADIPLIAYTLTHAKEYAKKTGADIALSTDDAVIRDTAAQWGVKTEYVRPAELASDTAGKVPVLKHALEYHEKKNGKRYDYLLDLDVTSPLRTMDDLDDCFATIDARPEALSIFSVSFPKHNPYSDMVEPDEQGFAKVCKDKGAFLSRQTSPKVYELNASYYFFRRKYFDENHPTQITPTSLAHVTKHMCFEIDDLIDMEYLDFLITKKKLDFPFPLPHARA